MTGWETVSLETLLAAGYALFLVLVAAGLELLARFTHRRVGDAKTVSFRYHRHVDAWQCSEGYFLWRQQQEQSPRIARYRAHAHICNKCASKCQCTDSDDGRELVRSLDAWPFTEIGRFQRGLSLTLLVLATLILAVETARHHQRADLIVLAAAFGAVLLVGVRTCKLFFHPDQSSEDQSSWPLQLRTHPPG
jgi:hypothetical protein